MRIRIALLSTLLFLTTPAFAQLSLDFASPGVNIGVNLGAYPTLQRVPGYPVYYAPGVSTNYFFYDGLYWVFRDDRWFASHWYNGPWHFVDPYDVPVYVLRVPVRYYRHAPAYFRGWHADEAPQWGHHWGSSWESRRHGWNEWNRSSVPAAAPLPTYQRQYTGNKYPQPAQQAAIQTQNYRYQPRDNVAREHFQYQRTQVQSTPPQPKPQQQQFQQSKPVQQSQPVQQQQQRQPQQQKQPQQQQQQQQQKQPQQQQQKQPQQQQQAHGQQESKGKEKKEEKDKSKEKKDH